MTLQFLAMQVKVQNNLFHVITQFILVMYFREIDAYTPIAKYTSCLRLVLNIKLIEQNDIV